MSPPSSDYKVQVFSPDLLSLAHLETFLALVRKGGEVNARPLPGLVLEAFAVGIVDYGGQIVAVGGIKRPNPTYREAVFDKAKVENPGRFPYELGWIFVEKDHRARGLASELVGALLERVKNARVYATSSADNVHMHKALKRLGFDRAGQEYPSFKAAKTLTLFIRDPQQS